MIAHYAPCEVLVAGESFRLSPRGAAHVRNNVKLLALKEEAEWLIAYMRHDALEGSRATLASGDY